MKIPVVIVIKLKRIAFLAFLSAFFLTCSSAPKRPPEVFTDRNMAENQLNLANQNAARGRFEDALLIVEDAYRLAVTTDDPPLRVRTVISRGNILFSLGRHEEAFQNWERAAGDAEFSGEVMLASLSRIYIIRAKLILLAFDHIEGVDPQIEIVEQLKAELAIEMFEVRTDGLSTAAGNVTLGIAEKQLGRWLEAEDAFRLSLAVHERNLYLEDAAYDWFLIASVCSLAKRYDEAINALGMAISFDRRAENGFGLASSWQALGEVYRKAGRQAESAAAIVRAEEIYRALGLEIPAGEADEESGGSSAPAN